MKYKVGDKVRIVSKWPEDGSARQSYVGRMDKWLGKVMTIRAITGARYHMEEDQGEWQGEGWYWYPAAIAGPAVQPQKIVVTTDGKTTTARMFSGKELVKTAEARCSDSDTFDFEKGAAIALDRLLGRDVEKPEPGFQRSDMVLGRFGRTSSGKWFVIMQDTVVYEDGGYDGYPNSDGDWNHYSVVCIVEARSFNNARSVASNTRYSGGKVIYKRPGAKFD